MGRIPLGLTSATHLAIIELAAEMKISELYAAEYALNLGLYQLKKLTQEDYELHKRKWSQKLVKEAEPKKLTSQEIEAKQKQDELRRYFESILNQWDLHKDDLGWVERTVNYARNHTETAEALMVVERGKGVLSRFLEVQKLGRKQT